MPDDVYEDKFEDTENDVNHIEEEEHSFSNEGEDETLMGEPEEEQKINLTDLKEKLGEMTEAEAEFLTELE